MSCSVRGNYEPENLVKVVKCIKRACEDRKWRYRQLVDRIARANDTGFSDDVVLAVLDADRGSWSKAMTLKEMLAYAGIELRR